MSKGFKITAWTLLGLIALIILIFVGYVVYLCCQYYRIAENQPIEITNNQTALVNTGISYTITTYNIGFGAYSQNFSFFMDTGELKDGTKKCGTQSVARNKDTVLANTTGALNLINDIAPDFAFFQEVDTKADRSYKVNQYEMVQEKFSTYSSASASIFHSGYLFYPLTQPHGASDSVIATVSKYNIESGVRKSFPIDESFPAKFFDLDRCFSVYTLPIADSNKKLVLINLHMSAYDEGGKIREQQLKMLTEYISAQYELGNYIIAGGDWNHDVADSINAFATGEKVPDWVRSISNEEIPEHFSFAKTTNAPTCRSCDIPYTLDKDGNLVNYTVVVDGFLVSDNITVNMVENIDTYFMYSDHNPVKMQFTLN